MDNPLMTADPNTDELFGNPTPSNGSMPTAPINEGNSLFSDDIFGDDGVNKAYENLGSRMFDGYCEAFVEQMTGRNIQGASAIESWNNSLQHAHMGLDGIKRGDLVYFDADSSNSGYGHVGIYEGTNKFISATYNGVESKPLDEWQTSTGQKVLGYLSH